MEKNTALALAAIKREGERAGRAARREDVALVRLCRNVADQARVWGNVDRDTFERVYAAAYKEGYGLPLL